MTKIVFFVNAIGLDQTQAFLLKVWAIEDEAGNKNGFVGIEKSEDAHIRNQSRIYNKSLHQTKNGAVGELKRYVRGNIMEIFHLQKIRMSGNEHGHLRADTIYAELVHDDGTLAISATLEYVLSFIRDRGLAVDGVTIQSKVQRKVLCSEVLLDNYKLHNQ